MSKIRRSAVKVAATVLAALSITAAASATAMAATPHVAGGDSPASYTLTSSDISVSYKNWDFPTVTGACATGYHVKGDRVGLGEFVPDVTVQQTDGGSGDLYNVQAEGQHATGKDGDGWPLYQDISVTLGNHSWSQNHTGTFTWTCESD